MPTPSQLNSLLSKYMYHDNVTVCRQINAVDDEGADDYTVQEIYVNIPCKLYQSGKPFTAKNTDCIKAVNLLQLKIQTDR